MSLSDKILKAAQDATLDRAVQREDATVLMPHVLRALDILQEHLARLEDMVERDQQARGGMMQMVEDVLALVQKHQPNAARVIETMLRLLNQEKVTPANYAQKREQILAQLSGELNPAVVN